MGDSNGSVRAGGGGISIIGLVGAGMAAWVSWQLNHSIIWCGVHAICGWLYLLYICLGCSGQTFPGGFW